MTYHDLLEFAAEKLAPEEEKPRIGSLNRGLCAFLSQCNDIAPLGSDSAAVAIVTWQWLNPEEADFAYISNS
jgi:hypothetical protein